MKKKNLVAKELRTQKFRPRIVKPKKGKGSFKRKKNNFLIFCVFISDYINIKAYYNSIFWR